MNSEGHLVQPPIQSKANLKVRSNSKGRLCGSRLQAYIQHLMPLRKIHVYSQGVGTVLLQFSHHVYNGQYGLKSKKHLQDV